MVGSTVMPRRHIITSRDT